jgi:hypothetical protein
MLLFPTHFLPLVLLTMTIHLPFSVPSPIQSTLDTLETTAADVRQSLSDLQRRTGPSLARASKNNPPLALIYAGNATTPDLAQSLGALLQGSPSNFSLRYIGGNASDEDWIGEVDMLPNLSSLENALGEVDVFAVPGGPGKILPFQTPSDKQYLTTVRF